MLAERERVEQRRWTCIREDNPHLMCFYASHGPQQVTLSKQSENGWAHTVLGWPLGPGATGEVELQPVVMRDGSMAVGVGSDAVMGSTTYKHPALLTYFFRDGSVTAATPGLVQSRRRAQHNEAVTLRVDRVNSTALWLVEGEVVG